MQFFFFVVRDIIFYSLFEIVDKIFHWLSKTYIGDIVGDVRISLLYLSKINLETTMAKLKVSF